MATNPHWSGGSRRHCLHRFAKSVVTEILGRCCTVVALTVKCTFQNFGQVLPSRASCHRRTCLAVIYIFIFYSWPPETSDWWLVWELCPSYFYFLFSYSWAELSDFAVVCGWEGQWLGEVQWLGSEGSSWVFTVERLIVWAKICCYLLQTIARYF